MKIQNKHNKPGRNDPCPCGSGLKYKKCCIQKGLEEQENVKDYYYKKHKIRIKEKSDIEAIKRAGKLVLKTLDSFAQIT